MRSKIKKSPEQKVSVSPIMLQCVSPLMAHRERYCTGTECRLSGYCGHRAKWTPSKSVANDPVQTYVGSASLTNPAWHKNVEAGCLFSEEDINDEMASEFFYLFAILEKNATPLTEEVLEEIKRRDRALTAAMPDPKDFWASPLSKNGQA